MLNCFVCDKIFNEVDHYITHLKYGHFFKTNDSFICQNNCFSKFNNINTFKRHLISHHTVNNDLNENYNSNTKFLQNDTDIQCSLANTDIPCSILHESSQNNDNLLSRINSQIFESNVFDVALLFLIKIGSISTASMNLMDIIIKYVTNDLFVPIFKELESLILPLISQNHSIDVRSILRSCLKPFIGMHTRHLFINALKLRNIYAAPKKIVFYLKTSICMLKGKPHLKNKKYEGTLLPIKFHIKKFFEIPNLLKTTIEHMDELSKNNDSICNLVQGKTWKRKIQTFPGRIIIPMNLYCDDFETGNALGSNSGSQSLTAFYYYFPTVPINLSSLCHIFTAAFFSAKHIKELGFEKALKLVIPVLKELEDNGIEIVTSDGSYRVHFLIGVITGDNLALNTLLGFSGSFSHNFFCRFCKISKADISDVHEERSCLLRNKLNYDADLAINNYPETGVKNSSIFNSLTSFHVTENFSTDIMHDVFEGVIKYGLANTLYIYILLRKNFFLLKFLIVVTKILITVN